MKKIAVLFLTLLSLVLFAAPASAACVEEPAQFDLLDTPPAAVPAAPEPTDVSGNTPQPVDEPAPPVDGSGDAPVDESAYREEPPQDDTPAQRLPGRGTVDDICAYWEENGYPDDVSYAYLGGGEMIGDTVYGWWEIGLVGNDPARQQEILDLMAPTSLVEFKNALFSHAEKAAAYDTITELAVTDPNILSVVFMRNDDTVWVTVPEALTKDYARYLIRDLGLGAVVSVTDEGSLAAYDNAVVPGGNTPGSFTESGAAAPGGGMDMGPTPGGAGASAGAGSALVSAPAVSSPLLWVCLAVLAALLTAAALRRRPAPAAVTETGAVHTAAPLTRKQTEALVADTVELPAPAVRDALLERVREGNSKK